MISNSDRVCDQWRGDCRIEGVDGPQLHHLYRAMAWLGEELPAVDQEGRTLVARCIKDLVEGRQLARRRSLLTDLSVAFMDTTSLYFEGEGAAAAIPALEQRGLEYILGVRERGTKGGARGHHGRPHTKRATGGSRPRHAESDAKEFE